MILISLLLNTFSTYAATAYQLLFSTGPVNTAVGAKLANVVVQITDKSGTNVSQSGTAITLSPGKSGGLNGITNATTDSSGKVTFTNLSFTVAVTNDTLVAVASGLKNATSSVFTISKGGTSTLLVSSTNLIVYGRPITFTATVSVAAPASGRPSGTVTFKDGAAPLGSGTLNASGVATFSTNEISAITPVHIITAVYGGDTNFSGSTSVNLSQTVGKAALTVLGISAGNKIYDGTTTATLILTNASLSGILSGDTVTLNTGGAKGAFANKNAGTGKTVTVSGLTIGGASSGNYSLTQPATTANITARNLTVTAKGVNKTYDGTTNATVTLSDNRVAGDVLTDSDSKASFTNKNVGAAILINVNGLSISGTDSANYFLAATNTTTSANITQAALTVSGIIASNKVYDGTTTATLNFSNATLVTILGGDALTLNTASAKGVFASKTVGNAKTVTISGLTINGTG
jgi:hypothetical protein